MKWLARAWAAIRPGAVPAAVFAVVLALIFWRAWTPLAGERRAFAWDAQWEYWGDLQFQADAVKDGELPLWNPHDRMGYPFFGDPQTGTLYPPQWPLIAAAAASGETGWGFVSAKILLHFELCALGMYALLRRRKLPAAACYLGGLVAITSYPMLHNSFSALNWSFAWIPWWLLATERWLDEDAPSWQRGAIAFATAALAALAGGWASVWFGALVVGPMAVVAIVTRWRTLDGDGRRRYGRAVLRSGAIGAAWFVLLAGAQMYATAQLLGDTVRSERGVTFFGTTVFDAVDVVGFFLPRAQGENTYLGWMIILFAGAYVAVKPSLRSLTLVGIFGLAVLCAMGDRGPALPSMASLVTPFEMFRRAHRYLYVGVIPVGILAAEGLALCVTIVRDDSAAALRRRVQRAFVVASGMMIVICGVGFAVKVAHPWKPDPVRDAFGWGLGATVVGGFLAWLVLRSPRLRGAAVIAVAVAGVDLWVARSGKVEAGFAAPPTFQRDRLLAQLPGARLDRRVYDRTFLKFRPGIRLGLRDFAGYEDDPLATTRYAMVREAVQRNAALAGHANIGWLLEGMPVLPHPVDPALHVLTGPQKGITEVSNAAAAVVWYDTAQLVPDAGAAWATITKTAPGTVAALETPTLSGDEAARAARVDAAATPTATGRLTNLANNTLRAEIDAPADGVVVLNELYSRRGWSATVDGAPAHIVAANGFARGVFVGPGHHVIAMRFAAPLYVAWALLGIAGWFALGAALWWSRRQKTRQG